MHTMRCHARYLLLPACHSATMIGFNNTIMRLGAEVKAIVSEGKGNFKKARFICMGTAAILLLATVVLHLMDSIAGWVGVLMLQIAFVLEACFLLLICLEFEERRGYDAPDMMRIVNALYELETVLRVGQIVHLLLLRSWVMTVVMAAVLVYDWTLKPIKKVDTTTLWKDIKPICLDSKIKTGINAFLFFAVLASMLYAVLGTALWS